MQLTLAHRIDELTRIFRSSADKHEAHRRSEPVLREMAESPVVLKGILGRYLSRAETLDTKHYPVIGIDVELNAHFGLVANCWIPLPDGRTDVSTKAIHHHGEMLLTTVTAFGPGYEHWTFTRPAMSDPERELFDMKVIEHGPHPRGHAAFVDAYIAHVPLYPRSLTVTLALWNHRKPTGWRDRLKRLAAVRGRERTLTKAAVRLGLSRALDLKVVRYFDYYPTKNGFRGMCERVEFERGPSSDFLYSLFHVLQRTENDDLATLVESHLESGRPAGNRDLVARLLEELKAGRDIEARLSEGHFDLAHANFTRDDMAHALSAGRLEPARA